MPVLIEKIGEVAERLKAPLSKSGILPKAGSWVRIPPSPPLPVSFPVRGGPAPATLVLSALCGEMSELAEGARLEIVCVVYSGTEGSNPSLSATALMPRPPFCHFAGSAAA